MVKYIQQNIKSKRLEQDSNLRGQSPTDFKSVPLTTLASRLSSGSFYIICGNNNYLK